MYNFDSSCLLCRQALPIKGSMLHNSRGGSTSSEKQHSVVHTEYRSFHFLLKVKVLVAQSSLDSF